MVSGLRILLVALAAFCLTDSLRADETQFRIPPTEPSDALKTFKLPPGFQIELVAAEPLIRDPVAIDFDESGRMYVVEYPEFNAYSFSKQPTPSGSIKLLEDTNSDGRFDESTVFLDKVAFPTAVACYDGGVFVGAAPDLLYCKDTAGDGHADVRRKVLTGFARDFAGGGLLNSFRWGLENRIHIATSFAGGNIRRADRPDDDPVPIRSSSVILDPRTHDFELTSGGGQHGMGVDDWGRKFLCSNVNPMQLLMYDGRYTARNHFFAPPAAAVDINGAGRLAKLRRISPLEPWRVERSRIVAASRPEDEGGQPGGLFTSSSGITIYRGDAWPEALHGNLFVGEVANNLVYRAKLEASGLGLVARRADREAEFLASTDIWFRPVQFANAPDGNLYVVDMYRELIEGVAFVPKRVLEELDASSGTDRGRIYRIVSVEQASRPAKRRVSAGLGNVPHKMPTEELVSLLEHTNGWHRDTAARLLYERQDARAVLPLRQLAANSKTAIGRVHALYALDGMERLTPEALLPRLVDSHLEVRVHALKLSEPFVNESHELRARLYSMADDGELRVRYQMAFSLGAISSCVARSDALARVLTRDADNQWIRTAVQSSLAEGGGDVLLTLSKMRQFRSSEVGRNFLQNVAAQIGARNRSSEVALLLKSLDSIPDEELAIKQAVTSGFLGTANDKVKQQVLTAGSSKLEELLTDLMSDARRTAASDDAPIDERVNAIHTLALAEFDDPGLHDLFAGLLELRQPNQIQSAALQTLAQYDHPSVPRLLHDKWPTLTPALRTQAMETMLSRTVWTLATLEAIVQKKLVRTAVSHSRLGLLKDHPNPEIQRRAQELLHAPTQRRQEVVAAYQSSLRMKGDAERGKTVFKKACSACHKLDGVGKAVGADLIGIGNRPAETILINVLDPNREAKPQFANYVLVTKDGRTVTGVIIEETTNSVRLVRADGSDATVLRIHIESLRNTGISFMPEGLEKQIDPQAMADLLAHLATFK